MKNRLFFKQLGLFLAVGILAFLITGYFIEKQITGDLRKVIEENLLAQARIIAAMQTDDIVKRSKYLSASSHARLTLIDASGNVISDSDAVRDMDNHLNRPEIQESRLKGKGSAIRYSRTLGTDMLYVALPLYEAGKISAYIRLALPLYQVSESLTHFRYIISHVFLMIIILSMLGALAFSLKVTAPIADMAEFTEKVKRGDVSGSIVVHSRDEIGQLAGNINEMVVALQEKITAALEEQEKLKSAFASMSEGVMVLDAENRIETLNKSMREILDARTEEIIGKTTLETFHSTRLHDAVEQVRATKQAQLQEIALGETGKVLLDVNVSVIKAPPGQPEKVMLVFHDVTRLKQLECVRADFVANVTHEIKTPLTAIIGFVETLQQGALDDGATARKFLQIIHDHALRLDRLVDDLLTLSRIELGETALEVKPFAFDHLLENILAVIHAKAAEKGLQIASDVPGTLPLLNADRDKISQILLNVLDNAVKFTPHGGRITVSVSVGKDDVLNIRISDTGIGIPKDEISRLGERFYRVDKTRSREMGGTGLGLSIVKHLLKVSQGWMDIESRPGAGTTVSLFIPLTPESDRS